MSMLRLTMTNRGSLPNDAWNSWSEGISALHGPHQLAQKSMRAHLPRNCRRFRFLPSTVAAVKAGAGCPTIAPCDGAGGTAGVAPATSLGFDSRATAAA